MSQGGYVTLIGFVAREPSLRTTKDGRQVADLRVGATTRYLDKTTGQWRDSDTSYFTVNCWRRLAGHVRASLHKGDPVMVKGHFRTRTYEDKQRRIRTEVEIVADTIGHDLSRGIANYIRPERPRQAESDGSPATDDMDMAESEMADVTVADVTGADGAGADVMGTDAGAGDAEDPSAQGVRAYLGSGGEIDEEEAVEEFNRELDKAPLPI